jgi:hypothetical protein
MTAKTTCEELDRFKRDAALAFVEGKNIRLSRDVSIYEDAELCREWHRRIHDLIKHLLVGHDGKACPAGDRPIVRADKPAFLVPTRQTVSRNHKRLPTPLQRS